MTFAESKVCIGVGISLINIGCRMIKRCFE